MTAQRIVALAGVVGVSMVLAMGNAGCAQRGLVAVRDSGDEHFKYGEYDAALKDYQEYIDRRPGNAHVHEMLGNTYLKLNETGLACEQLKLAHTLRMEDDEIFASLCEGLYADKKYDDLNRLLRERTIDRGRMQDWALLAKYSERLGDRDEAQRAWLTAAKVDGGRSVVPQLGLARLYKSVGDLGRARTRAAMAYYCDPTNGEVAALARELGEVPGPTFGVPPIESRMAAVGSDEVTK
jgi:predicted Zn-dependent protease